MPWFVARTQTFRIRFAIKHLTLRGFTVYCPRVLKRSRKKYDHKSMVEVPLFPDYVFVEQNASGQWHAINNAPGVVRVLCDGGVAALMRDEIIEDIKRRERSGLVVLPERGLKIGSPVKVTNGVFYGLSGLVHGLNGHDRCLILLDLLGAACKIELPKDHIELR